ncbi:MAG: hypothetical protein ABI647_20790 [Gemmatimonadota bacterium]
MPRLERSIVTAIALLGAFPEVAVAQSCPADTITRQELGAAMREARLAPGGDYAVLATMNSMRFQSAVFQRLIQHALARRPDGGTFFIPHDILWWEFLKVAGLRVGEEDKAPIGRRLAFEYHQSIEVTYGRPDSVIKETKHGPSPSIAANVRLEWPDRPDGVRKFSFVDTLSVPQLQMTSQQVSTFRFLVFSDMIAFDEIQGMSGRPVSGLLGTLFKLLGEGRAVYSRFSIAPDGMQVMRAKAKRLISKTVTVTTNPDGRAQNGVPDDRPDLAAIEARLQEPLDFEYYPYRCSPSTD